jgi:hypothetical protein
MAMLLAALDALNAPLDAAEDAGGPIDTRSQAQRNADAFAEILRRYLESGKAGDNGGLKTGAYVTVDLADLTGDDPDVADLLRRAGLLDDTDVDTTPARADTTPGNPAPADHEDDNRDNDHKDDQKDDDTVAGHVDAVRPDVDPANLSDPTMPAGVPRPIRPLPDWLSPSARLSHVGAISRWLAQLLVCDSTLTGMASWRGRPLALGRTQRLANAALRRYLGLRDGGCAFPGCAKDAEWCDAHHIVWWSHGGVTAPVNLVLVCRRHHTELHNRTWQVRMDPGELPVFIPPWRVDPQRRPIPANRRRGTPATPAAA